MTPLDVIAAALILSGVSLTAIGALGLQQFPDVFARMHAASKPVTLGLVSVLVGAAITMDHAGDAAKLLLVAVVQLLTAPITSHMVSRAAYRSGTELSPDTRVDELAAVEPVHGGGDESDGAVPPRP